MEAESGQPGHGDFKNRTSAGSKPTPLLAVALIGFTGAFPFADKRGLDGALGKPLSQAPHVPVLLETDRDDTEASAAIDWIDSNDPPTSDALVAQALRETQAVEALFNRHTEGWVVSHRLPLATAVAHAEIWNDPSLIASAIAVQRRFCLTLICAPLALLDVSQHTHDAAIAASRRRLISRLRMVLEQAGVAYQVVVGSLDEQNAKIQNAIYSIAEKLYGSCARALFFNDSQQRSSSDMQVLVRPTVASISVAHGIDTAVPWCCDRCGDAGSERRLFTRLLGGGARDAAAFVAGI